MVTGAMEILVVVALVAVLFGPGKLGEVMGALGKGVKDFKEASDEARRPPPASDDDEQPRKS